MLNCTEQPTIAASGRQRADYTRQRASRRSKLTQCLEMQERLEKRILDLSLPDEKLASLISAWDKLEDRVRILRNKPLPGSLVHEKRSSVRNRGAKLQAMLASEREAAQSVEAADQQPSVSSADAQPSR